ncbi:hypothetical protein [Deinococcus sp. AJ005]|uniref:hypothetical protein n=1 Tax=Deinococcus sp. AJ005 TaxID=2652443 RepID=UPI00125CC45B|nr:hypothetical protein [Deinococcus sp. AJ005]QFP75716.1 hypothetical protein DAAJ005_04010 [Deinococcus sp. AJ005]
MIRPDWVSLGTQNNVFVFSEQIAYGLFLAEIVFQDQFAAVGIFGHFQLARIVNFEDFVRLAEALQNADGAAEPVHALLVGRRADQKLGEIDDASKQAKAAVADGANSTDVVNHTGLFAAAGAAKVQFHFRLHVNTPLFVVFSDAGRRSSDFLHVKHRSLKLPR